MPTTKRSLLIFNLAIALLPLVLLISAVIHSSRVLAITGVLMALTLGVTYVLTRNSGETGRLLGGRADDERHEQFQLRAWATTGQVLMLVLLGLWLLSILTKGEVVSAGAMPWVLLFGAGGLTGGVTVLWLRLRH